MTKSTSGDRDRDLAVGDLHVVAHDAHLRIEDGLAGGDVVLPGMPWAAQNAAFLAVLELVDGPRQRGADDPTEADARGLMRTRVLQREKLAIQVEHADFATFESH